MTQHNNNAASKHGVPYNTLSTEQINEEVLLKAKLPQQVRDYINERAIGPYNIATLYQHFLNGGEEFVMNGLRQQQRWLNLKTYGADFPDGP